MSYDSDVVSATSGRGEPDWDKIIKLCNRIRDSVGTLSMAQAMGSVMRRVKHTDSGIQLHALTLLEACVGNCGQDFQLELTKSTFHSDVKTILSGPYTDARVKQRLKELLGSWVTEFKNNAKMSPLIKFVEQLRQQGVAPQSSPAPVRQQQQPAAASAPFQEDADLKKAIELSLRDSNATPPASNPSLYPSVGSTPAQRQPQKKAGKKVRAIYDFVAAEDNELSFRAGEILTVLDDSDENWWRGETQLGKGLFPASFVSANLSVETQPSNVEVKGTKAASGQGKKSKKSESKKAVVNEQKIDLFLEMIKGADVTSEENKAENETLLELEGECKRMKPLVDNNIASLQKQEDEMLEINKKFEDALALYRKVLAEGPRLSTTVPQKQPTPVAPQPQPGASEPSHYHTQQPSFPTQAQPHSTHAPQSFTTLPPQSHATLAPPQAQPHSTLPPPAQSYTTTQLPQPPPYTANSVASSVDMYSNQSGFTAPQSFTPDPASFSQQPSSLPQQPNSLSFASGMMGSGPPSLPQAPVNLVTKPAYQQQSYYTPQQPNPVPSQMRSGLSPSPVAPPVPQQGSYQPAFYPQQQQTHLVQQPLL